MLLNFKNISKTFYTEEKETKVLDHISFTVNENEIVSILGPSGCGKSTILNIINQLTYPTTGEIELTAKLGYMFQKDCLMPWKSVYKNIIIGLEINKKDNQENLAYACDLIKKYHLEEFKSFSSKQISGGMKQRVSLIRTLVLKPDLLLLDEPFSALDFQTRLQVQNDVYQIIKQEKKSALIITHDIQEAIALSDRIIILSNRPTKIIDIVNIENNFSPTIRRKDPSFVEYYNQINLLLNIDK